jgi:uncharacterized protein DUF4124
MDLLRTTAFILAASLASPAMATVLYKSIAANGVVEFSDVPPADNSKLVEQREMGASAAASGITTAAAIVTQSTPLVSMEALISDDVVARASEKVDLAEHALALARRDLWTPHDGLHLKGPAHTAADEQRVEYFKRGVLAARQALMDTLRERLASR